MTTITTETICYSPGTYARNLVDLWIERNLYWLIIPLLACCFAAFYRWEWLVVMFAIILLVYPFVLFNVFLRYGTKIENMQYIKPFKVKFSPDNMRMVFDGNELMTIQLAEVKKVAMKSKSLNFIFHNNKAFVLIIRDDRWTEIEDKIIVMDMFAKNGIKIAGR